MTFWEDTVHRLRERLEWAESAGQGRHQHAVLVLKAEELRQLEDAVWRTTGCRPAHIEGFVGRKIVVDDE